MHTGLDTLVHNPSRYIPAEHTCVHEVHAAAVLALASWYLLASQGRQRVSVVGVQYCAATYNPASHVVVHDGQGDVMLTALKDPGGHVEQTRSEVAVGAVLSPKLGPQIPKGEQ